MLKKTLLIALAAASAAIAAAPVMAANNSPFTGFYAGVGATRDTADFDFSGSGNDLNLSGTGFGGNLFAGYGYAFCNGFYLGGEAFGSVSSLKSDELNSTLKLKNSYGLSVLPGYMITNNTLGYVRIGYVKSQFQGSSTGGNSSNENFNGVQYGVGLQTALANNLSLRGEYIYTNYQSKNTADSTVSLKPKTDQFGLSLAYNFG